MSEGLAVETIADSLAESLRLFEYAYWLAEELGWKFTPLGDEGWTASRRGVGQGECPLEFFGRTLRFVLEQIARWEMDRHNTGRPT